VFPLRGKVPMISHGLNAASTDPERVKEWWARWPEANIGLCTGSAAGFWVLDLDIKDGRNGNESLDALEAEHGATPETLTIRTGSGGLHAYFATPPDREVRNRSNVRPGIDVRGDGGYVVAPPSIHPETGVLYEVLISRRVPIAEAPPWLLELVAPIKPAVRIPPPAPTGIKLPPGEHDREVARRLRTDPGTRARLGEARSGKLSSEGSNASIKGVVCPSCGRPSVWWPIYPRCTAGNARCAHLNSCGWWGPLSTFL
jgi:hypothetical protein